MTPNILFTRQLLPEYHYLDYMLVNAKREPLALVSLYRARSLPYTAPFSITIIQSLHKGAGQQLLTEVIKDLPCGLIMPRNVSEKFKAMFRRLHRMTPLVLHENTPFTTQGEDAHNEPLFDLPLTLFSPPELSRAVMTEQDVILLHHEAAKALVALDCHSCANWYINYKLPHWQSAFSPVTQRDVTATT